jgi:hypothetical protein
MIERTVTGGEPMDWFLIISWRQGGADNRRTEGGGVAWERTPHEGWVVDLGAWEPNKVPSDLGTPLYRDVRLMIQDHVPAPGPFPGGEVYVEDGQLRVRVNAI